MPTKAMPTSVQPFDSTLKRLDIGERLIRRNPLYYGSVQRQLSILGQEGLSGRKAWTEHRLRLLLRAAGRTPYGRRAGAPLEIGDWPLLRKEVVREDPRAFQSRWRWLAARAHTGGTTGTPLKLVRSPQAIVAEQAAIDRMMVELEVDPRNAKMALLRADNIKDPSDTEPPYWIYALGGRRLILSANHLSERTLPEYVKVLRQFEPELLWASPTPLESLCRLLQRAGARLRIPAVLASSEMFRPAVWRLAQAVLDCAIVDYYGQAERVAFAWARAPERYYFLPGYAHVELIPHARHESAQVYEVVGTSLWNTAMPLVRYCTGDLVCLPPHYGESELEEVTLGVRPFEGVIGRSQDVLLAPDGAGILTGISHIPRAVEHVLRVQIAQEALDCVVLRVLPDVGFSREDAEHLMRNARSKIPETVKVRLEVVDALERTARGKTPFVIHSPPVQDAFRRAGFEVRAK